MLQKRKISVVVFSMRLCEGVGDHIIYGGCWGGGGGLLAVGWAVVSMPKYNRSPQGGG